MRVRGYGYIVDKGGPGFPVLDVEESIVDEGGRARDVGGAVDGEEACAGDFGGWARGGVGRVVEGGGGRGDGGHIIYLVFRTQDGRTLNRVLQVQVVRARVGVRVMK